MGLHVNSGYTVFWGLVSLEHQRVTREEFDEALREAGLDLEHHAAQVDYETVAERSSNPSTAQWQHPGTTAAYARRTTRAAC